MLNLFLKKLRLNLWLFVYIKLTSDPRSQGFSSELKAKARQLAETCISFLVSLCYLYCITIRVRENTPEENYLKLMLGITVKKIFP